MDEIRLAKLETGCFTRKQGDADNHADIDMNADNFRSAFSVDGTGVKIGALSDTVNRAARTGEELHQKEEQAKREKERATAARARSRRYGSSRGGRRRQSAAETMTKSVLRSAGRTIGRELVRGLLGSLFKGR